MLDITDIKRGLPLLEWLAAKESQVEAIIDLQRHCTYSDQIVWKHCTLSAVRGVSLRRFVSIVSLIDSARFVEKSVRKKEILSGDWCLNPSWSGEAQVA